MYIPTIADIEKAAKASARTNPRPTRAFWLTLLWSFSPSTAQAHADAKEEDLRAAVVGLAMRHGYHPHETLMVRWAEVFGLDEQAEASP